MDWKTETVKLIHPIAHEEKTYEEITLREPNVEMLEAVDELGIEPGSRIKVKQMRGIVSILGDMPNDAVGKMHRDDMAAIAGVAAPLLFPEEAEEKADAS